MIAAAKSKLTKIQRSVEAGRPLTLEVLDEYAQDMDYYQQDYGRELLRAEFRPSTASRFDE